MSQLFFEMNAYDINTRIADEGRVPLVPLIHVHELSQGGLVMEDDNVKVTAALVHHPPVVPAFGYRFDGAIGPFVISGDTTPSDNLIKRAQGADVLVHDALYTPASIVSSQASQRHLLSAEHLLSSHHLRKTPGGSRRQPASRCWFSRTWCLRRISP
jgi:ribonuclease BN (tRNA processing enzyme)